MPKPQVVKNGLLVWKKYDHSLTLSELSAEIDGFGNEGLEFVFQRNSDTVLMFMTNDGRTYSMSRLNAMGVDWMRCVETHNMLRSKAKSVMEEIE